MRERCRWVLAGGYVGLAISDLIGSNYWGAAFCAVMACIVVLLIHRLKTERDKAIIDVFE